VNIFKKLVETFRFTVKGAIRDLTDTTLVDLGMFGLGVVQESFNGKSRSASESRRHVGRCCLGLVVVTWRRGSV
jgi:hypothetical protein